MGIVLQMFPFLRATRFWAMTIAALSIYAQSKGWIGEPEMLLIATITAGFVTVRTIDRATERKILAEAVGTGQIAASDVLEVPPPKADALGGGPVAPAKDA